LAIHTAGTRARRGSFAALLATQALSAFSQNALRAGLLALATFKGISAFGWSVETVIGLSTILVTLPYFVLSIAAGRIADTRPRAQLIRQIKAGDIVSCLVAAYGLLTMNLPVLLAALLLTSIASTLLGPAKFGILPDLIGPERLMRANAWMSASNTLAILLGLIAGSLLMDAPLVLAALGICLALIGFATSLAIRPVAEAPASADGRSLLVADHLEIFIRLRQTPGAILPILGLSWFWFQGALNTTMFPVIVSHIADIPADSLTLLFIITTVGVALGALAARRLRLGAAPRWLALVFLAVVALPALDILFALPLAGTAGLVRLGVDIFLISIGTGFYVVPLITALQLLAAPTRRARLIGINHAANGLAMMAAGVLVTQLGKLGLSVEQAFVAAGVVSGLVGAWSLLRTPAPVPQSAQAA
jgi:MFS family permease